MRKSIAVIPAALGAFVMLAGCDATGRVDEGVPANGAAENASASATAVPRRLKPLFVTGSTLLDPESDIDTVVVMARATIGFPPASSAGLGRVYVIHAREGPVVLRFSGNEGVEGTRRVTLNEGETATLMSTGERSWIRLQDSAGT
jgi:hypothetical protein